MNQKKTFFLSLSNEPKVFQRILERIRIADKIGAFEDLESILFILVDKLNQYKNDKKIHGAIVAILNSLKVDSQDPQFGTPMYSYGKQNGKYQASISPQVNLFKQLDRKLQDESFNLTESSGNRSVTLS